ncbi:MAG: malto-oligosyltrehalose synthase [Alteromonadaceae bacterium]|nr:malto-oligosyltrehalose synthase [Alteromonadaceae bacterium]
MTQLVSTIRLQFHADFTLDDAAQLVDYFSSLGVTHIYASPLLASRAGSAHGYDGIDPTRLDPELGDEAALERLVKRLREKDMGLVMDIVPNHVAVGGSENQWWQDVLRWGRQSRYADFFDIDWESPDPLLTGKVLVPFLGQPYGESLISGDLKLGWDSGFHVDYHEHRFPIDPRTYGLILAEMGGDDLEPIRRQCAAAESAEDLVQTHEALGKVLDTRQGREQLDQVVACFDGRSDDGSERLHRLLEEQNYRLAWWRTASDDINWRRFFDVTELGGLRIELPHVFEEVHSEIFRLVELGWVDGLRVDHVDGLVDPRGYCRKLRSRLDELAERRPDNVPRRVALFVEKILAADEPLHQDWQVDGTTGYEFMNDVSALQHDPSHVGLLRDLWRETSGRSDDFHLEERRARIEILRTTLASEFSACARALLAVARQDLSTRDFTLGAVKRTLAALIRHFRVYRTYADQNGRPPEDESFFQQAMAGAKQELNDPDHIILTNLERWLGGEAPSAIEDATERALRLKAIARFQQLTSPVAAKAVEDTAGYRSAVLISRNDVGFEPDRLSYSPLDFHQACGDRARYFPRSMVTTATHDHKRGEDVRARLAALSEQAGRFASDVRRWQRDAEPLRQKLSGGLAPAPADELILYQILLGSWPLELDDSDDAGITHYRDRLLQWHEKALREAKLHSHWLWPDAGYERACSEFLTGLFETAALRRDIANAARSLDVAGAVNGLAQTTLRITVPGIPDLYQGTEFWDLSLVDPDNRRPVDYALRAETLRQNPVPTEALEAWRNGQVKQALIARLLHLRRDCPELFLQGSYEPVDVVGSRARHVVAFIRRRQREAVLVVVPRLPSTLLEGAELPVIAQAQWGDTRLQLPEGFLAATSDDWQNLLSDEELRITEDAVPVAKLLAEFPVGVLKAR